MKNYEKKALFSQNTFWPSRTKQKNQKPRSVHDYTTAQARKLNFFKNIAQTHRRNG